MIAFLLDSLQIVMTGDYIGGSLAGLTEEDSPIVSVLLTVHHLIF